MSKLSLDALKERAEATASTELLATISGGLENACHNSNTPVRTHPADATYVPKPRIDTIRN
ncbi:MAG: hypothetical protein KA980_11900 [Flavobacterium sp.]|jgi:hypothetical protein|nr:hypothetical protein [Flavobacterium sp.]MBP7318905.1 hypothetical protein [Flavobacterium sp.]